eukprot:7281863-Alexandrium_andersonii.AAC.1
MPSAQHGMRGWLLGSEGGCGLGGSLGPAWAGPLLWRGAAATYGGVVCFLASEHGWVFRDAWRIDPAVAGVAAVAAQQ